MTLKLLIADDASDVAEVVAFGATMTWPDCQVTIAGDGAEALRQFDAQQPDLVILDVSMPPPDGFEVCRRIREVSIVPILMLTERDATLDKVRALDLGADDYLTKPFDHLELLARLRAIVGIVGALIGGFLWGLLTNDPEPYQFFDLGSWITAIVGACIVVFLVGLFTGRRRV